MKTTEMIRIRADLEWRIEQSAEMPVWIGICDALQLTVQSDSWRELAEDISETLDVIFFDLIAENQLNEFLASKGWNLESEIPSQLPPDVKFDVPFAIVPAAA